VFEIGNSLREARSRRGVDFAQAEMGTKIRGKYLRALEDEQFELLPAQTYVKGFLRTYAEYLGLDGQLYVDEYNSRFVIGEAESVRTVRRSNARPHRRTRGFETSVVLVALAAIAVVTVVVISAWKSAGGNGNTPNTPPTSAASTRHKTGKTAVAPLLTVIGVRGSTHVTARRGSATGAIAFDGTIGANDPQSIHGSRLWVQIDAPENLKILVRGHLVHVPGHAPSVIVVTGSGWHPA
jgi:cytoskeletal protein RodZ